MRPELGDPAPSADLLLMTDYRAAWTRLRDLGLAVMPGATLHAYAERHGRLRWNGRMPEGCVGAPVFTGIAVGGGQYRLVCLGAVLPGESRNHIAPFDRIRRAVAALATPATRRRWQRFGG